MLRQLLLFLMIVWAGQAFAEPVYPPGLRIGLEPPGEARVSTQFPGFEDPDRKVKITLLDLPAGAYEGLESSAFAPDQQGLANVTREAFPFGSGIGILLTGTAEQNGAKIHKWYLLAKAVAGPAKDLTTLINVEVPEAARSVYTDEVVRKALASVTFRAAPLAERLELLPFTISELSGFRVMQALPSSGVILTDGPGEDLDKQPYMIVSIGRGAPSDASDRGRFARDLLNGAPLRELKLRSSEPMRISGWPGHEIRATAKSLSGQPVTLVQWVRFGGSGFLRIIGVGSEEAWDGLFSRFRAIRDGIDPK